MNKKKKKLKSHCNICFEFLSNSLLSKSSVHRRKKVQFNNTFITYLVYCKNGRVWNLSILLFLNLFFSVEQYKWLKGRWCIHFESLELKIVKDAKDSVGFFKQFRNENQKHEFFGNTFAKSLNRDYLLTKFQ